MIVEMHVPSPGESITEVEIVKWLKADGDYVLKDEPLCEIESEKVTLTMHADAAGMLKILVEQKNTVAVGTLACTIDTEAKQPESARTTAAPKPSVVSLSPSEQQPASSAAAISSATTLPSSPKLPPKPLPSPPARVKAESERIQDGRPIHREKMSQLRLKVSQRLVAVKNTTAMLTTFNEADMSAVQSLRSRLKEQFEKEHGVRLGLMSFFVKAVCEAIRDYPAVNALIDGEEILFHDYVDIGVAVSAPKGLMVPIVRNAHQMTFAQIESQIAELAAKARDNKLGIDDLTGGTFTISNGGVFGSLLSTPILNPPQSAILGLHTIQDRPIAIDGQVAVRPMMYLALSYDHRIIDGRESVGFLKKIKEYIEDPVGLMLGAIPT
jgi:2-oxoglutarate dehydrogenase E2 component (dihydrolipoamide succinyltransferase)